jgi:putative signal transducing protein
MWTCPKCREDVEDELEVCWSCGTTIEGIEDPNFFDEPGKPRPQTAPGESPESLVTVAKCSLPGEAHAMRVRLESEGIPVFLFDEFTITMDWLLSNAIGGVKVQVPDHCLERAREILGIMADEEDEEADTEHEGAAADQEDDESEEDTDPGDDAEPEEGIMDPDRS